MAGSRATSERQVFLRERDALNLKDNDALWLLLMVLGHYETLYGRFPSLIAKAAADVTENAKAAAEAELKAAAARTRAELAKSVAQTALDIADRVASTKRSKWALTGFALAAAIFVGVGSAMYRAGSQLGKLRGAARRLLEGSRREGRRCLGEHARGPARIRSRQGRQPPRPGHLLGQKIFSEEKRVFFLVRAGLCLRLEAFCGVEAGAVARRLRPEAALSDL